MCVKKGDSGNKPTCVLSLLYIYFFVNDNYSEKKAVKTVTTAKCKRTLNL